MCSRKSSLFADLIASLVDFTWNVEREKIFPIYPIAFIAMSRSRRLSGGSRPGWEWNAAHVANMWSSLAGIRSQIEMICGSPMQGSLSAIQSPVETIPGPNGGQSAANFLAAVQIAAAVAFWYELSDPSTKPVSHSL
jgi:hypothetical protein